MGKIGVEKNGSGWEMMVLNKVCWCLMGNSAIWWRMLVFGGEQGLIEHAVDNVC